MGFRGPAYPLPGRPARCGRYELLEQIGTGGMAEIFRARLKGPSGFEKSVVIKRILPSLANDSMIVRMFVEEARIAAAADHENIAQVFELGQSEDGQFFLVMEHLRGVDLAALLEAAAKRHLRLPPWFSVHVVVEVLEALAFVHALTDENGRPRHVIHRDVTPSNIFVSRQGRVKLSDFGIADFEGKAPTTRAGQIKGKLAYLSPEQLQNQSLDQRSDIFTVGVMLWECLTQQRLFGGLSELQAMLAICEGPRQKPSSIMPQVSPLLDTIALKALEPKREQRFASARAFQAELLRALAEHPQQVRPEDVRLVVEAILGKRAPEPITGTLDLPLRLDDSLSFSISIEDPLIDSETEAPVDETYLRAPLSEDAPAVRLDLNETVDEYSLAVSPLAELQQALGEEDRTVAMRPPDLAVITTGKVADVRDSKKSSGSPSFWLRKPGEGRFGPYSFDELMVAMAPLVAQGGSGAVSADGSHWLDAADFFRLTRQSWASELETGASNFTVVGSLQQRSLPAVLGLLARDRVSGVLTLARTDADGGAQWYAIYVHDGQPTRVSTSATAMQTPRLLVSLGILTSNELPGVIHTVLRERRDLLDVVEALGHRLPGRAQLHHERLVELFRWETADYSFNVAASRERQEPPFSRSLLALTVPGVYRALSEPELTRRTQRWMRKSFEPSWRFKEGLQEMALDSEARRLAETLASRRPLVELCQKAGGQLKLLLALAYALRESDLLLETLE